MVDLKVEYVLICVIVGFLLYHLMNRCGCSDGFKVDAKGICKCESQNTAAVYGGEHDNPFNLDYCSQFTQEEYPCEQVYYKNLGGDFKTCNWSKGKCTSEGNKSCTRLKVSSKKDCTNNGEYICCSHL